MLQAHRRDGDGLVGFNVKTKVRPGEATTKLGSMPGTYEGRIETIAGEMVGAATNSGKGEVDAAGGVIPRRVIDSFIHIVNGFAE